MTTYQDLHWDSLNFVRSYLYPRLVLLLSHALTPSNGPVAPGEDAWHSLEAALNLVKAWSALIQVKSGGTIAADQRRLLAPETLPIWLKKRLEAFGALYLEHRQPVVVHLEAFYESLILMSEIAAKSGPLKSVALANNPGELGGVWVRAAFDPPPAGLYAGLKGLLDGLDADNEAQQHTAIQVHVLQDLCALNGATLRIQTNTTTGAQALAAHFAHLVAPIAETLPAALVVHEHAEIENRSETLIVPPPGLQETLAALLGEAPALPAFPENLPETLIVPPPGFEERLAALASLTAAPETVENVPETLFAPPPDLHERPEAESAPAQETTSAPPEESAGQVTVIKIGAGSDTVIFSTAGPSEEASPAPDAPPADADSKSESAAPPAETS